MIYDVVMFYNLNLIMVVGMWIVLFISLIVVGGIVVNKVVMVIGDWFYGKFVEVMFEE